MPLNKEYAISYQYWNVVHYTELNVKSSSVVSVSFKNFFCFLSPDNYLKFPFQIYN